MNYDKLILDFADGTLDSSKEEELFFHLSVNEEMRGKLKQLMAIENSIQDNTAYFAPPAESTMKVFSALGFSAPVEAAAAAQSAGLLAKLGSMATKYIHLIGTGVAATVATTLVFIYGVIPGVEEDLQKETIANIKSTETELVAKALDVPVVGSFELLASEEIQEQNTNITEASNIKQNSNRNNYFNTSTGQAGQRQNSFVGRSAANNSNTPSMEGLLSTNNLPDNTIEDNNDINEDNIQLLSRTEIDFGDEKYFGPKVTRATSVNVAPILFNIDLDNIRGAGLQVDLWNSKPWHITSGDGSMEPKKSIDLNNWAIAVHKDIGKNFSIGADYRLETFYQEYEGISSDGRAAKYEQQANFNTVGASIKWNYASIGNLKLNTKLNFGINELGFTQRLAAGASYNISSDMPLINDIFLFVDGEYSNMLFKHQGDIFNASKYNVNVGFGLAL